MNFQLILDLKGPLTLFLMAFCFYSYLIGHENLRKKVDKVLTSRNLFKAITFSLIIGITLYFTITFIDKSFWEDTFISTEIIALLVASLALIASMMSTFHKEKCMINHPK